MLTLALSLQAVRRRAAASVVTSDRTDITADSATNTADQT